MVNIAFGKFKQHISLLWLFLYCLTLVISIPLLWQYNYQQLQLSNQQQLDRFNRHLDTQLGHFAFIPQLLSGQEAVINALQINKIKQLDLTNHHLASINRIIGSSDTYLLDKNGKTIASSNWDKKVSFIGKNFAFRPYYQDAIKGSQGRYFALGSTSGKRGYYFSAPVINKGTIMGVIVVKMDLSLIEDDWEGKEQLFLVTDHNNIVFISSEKEWLFQSLTPLSNEQKNLVFKSRRYLSQSINSLYVSGDASKNATLLKIKNKSYLSLIKPATDKQWTVRVLVPVTSIIVNISILILVITLVFIMFNLIIILFKQKQSRHQEQALQDAKSKQQLELTVMERTSALQAEIQERLKAERALRSTQKELIQSAKLAVLGQLSASISHELNNPLSAIRSYAENAILFLERNKLADVNNNLSRIALLTERMAKISYQLKSFARKSNGELKVSALQPILLSAYELFKPQLKANQTELRIEIPSDSIVVKVEPIQLEQIVINLFSNALQSMQKSKSKVIEVEVVIEKGFVVIEVLDKGTGISEENLLHLFDPFFTTKETGLGLGLSISQQIIHNMQGEISARNRNECGAIFSIKLPIYSHLTMIEGHN